jgi:bifunctional UDP-N-acetylglucosamine pyrophosphorylase / glucosamine-1-phosphate N-acetyltransferase
VTLLDPETTWIEPAVQLQAGVILHPFVHLCGATRIAAGCEVRSFSTLRDTEIAEGTLVNEHSVLEGTVAGPACKLGPFCHTRPGTVLEEHVHLGNFVETKKSRLGRYVKANHLSYLGDATVGADSNIGAGTITCNYDGVDKHPTVLGEGVFVGSDTQLVAPVTVGDGAYIGAGATVTKDVPAGALAISRVPQKNVEGWAEKRKSRRAGEPESRGKE